MPESRHQLRDRGDQFVDFARANFGEEAATVIRGEVEKVRRASGTLDTSTWRSTRGGGPMHLLSSWLGSERIGFEVWAESGFGMFDRRKNGKRAGDILQEQGPDAAVDWVLANATKATWSLSTLQSGWEGYPFVTGPDEDFYAREMASSLRSWKR